MNKYLLAGLAAWVGFAQAQVFDTPPRSAEPRPLRIQAPSEQRLPNGLRVVVAHRPGVQLVTARLVWLSGSEVDPPQRAGLAAITAGLLTKGTQQYSATEQMRRAESLGGALDSGAGWDQSSVGITVAAVNLDAALALVADAALHPRFEQQELDRLRTQALDGLKVAYAQPGTLASLAAERLTFGDGPYGHPANGTPNSLPRLTRADVQALYAEHYRPGNAVLVLAGDVDSALALRLTKRHFSTWKAVQLSAATKVATPSISLPTRAVVIDMPGSGQASVVLAVPMPRLGTDRAAGAVMNAVLGGGYSSRLNQEVRIKRGLSYGAGSHLDTRRQSGALVARVQTKNESAAEVLALLQGELDRLIATPVGADELSARKATLIGGFSRSVETTEGLGAAIQALIVAGLPLTDLASSVDRLSAVQAADVQRIAAAHTRPDSRRVAVAGDAGQFAAPLKVQLPDAITIPISAFDLDCTDALTPRNETRQNCAR